MGIARAGYRLLLEEKKKGNLRGERLLQLGRQSILFNHATLLKYAEKHHVSLTHVAPSYRKSGFIDDQTLFKALGFHEVHSLDYSDYEGSDILWDLNHPIPEKYWGQFDVIYDGGTVEHIFNFPEVLANIYRLLKVGGRIIHVSPSNNHVDHGFYMFSPQVYLEYYSANGYEILTSQIFEYTPKHRSQWHIYDYQIGTLDSLAYGGFGNKMLAIHLIAMKKKESTSHIIPQQRRYMNEWSVKTHHRQLKKGSRAHHLIISLMKKVYRRLPHKIQLFLKKRKMQKVAIY